MEPYAVRTGHKLLIHNDSLDTSQRHPAKWKKQHKRITWHRSRLILGDRNQTGYQLGVGEVTDWKSRGHILGSIQVSYPDGVWVTQGHPFVNNIQPRFVRFNLSKCGLNLSLRGCG